MLGVGPTEMISLDVFLAMLRARKASARSKGIFTHSLILGELSKFNMKKGVKCRDEGKEG